MAPWYGWLIGLTTYMNNNFSGRWAYTGSFAMYLHAARRNRENECRQPNDIDILCENVSAVWTHLRADLNSSSMRVPGIYTEKATLEDCKIKVIDGPAQITTESVKIDILQSSPHFGNLSSATTVTQGAVTTPYMPPPELLNRLRNIKKDGLKGSKSHYAEDKKFLKTFST